ncbi:MAG: exodeoxyribonuclease VII large subunit [Oscillospiraceae bacterium]|nr:exodeoxyribonuclease VII large subunit [Oscillospiraceae bacterium]
MMSANNTENKFIATVSQVNRRVSLTLKNDAALSNICVKGEVLNFVSHYKSGHLYFTLKDEEAALKCVMFALEAEKLTFTPEDGQNVIASGRISVYERDGVYQLYTTSLELPDDEQDTESLFAAFLKLKEKLEKEGIFANSRPLPTYPRRICLITAKDSAALQDMLAVFERRYPLAEVLLIPALVQGKSAPVSVINGLKTAQKLDADLIIIARGGGSAEDLWAFNDEALAREIYASLSPVVSAIGHETDFTLADFAADLRAPTPTAAAELSTPDLSELPLALDSLIADLRRRVVNILERREQRLEYLAREINLRVKNLVIYKKKELEAAEELIHALSPQKVFSRGFAAVFKGGKAVRSAKDAEIGDELGVKLAEGNLTVVVKEKK